MALTFTMTGLFRRFRSLLLGRQVEVVGQCRLCGACCRNIILQDKGRWLKREKDFRKLCRDEPEFERFTIVEKDEVGHLVFDCSLQKDNLCSCHEDRLPLCRNYPTKSLYYQGGIIPPDCGYSFKAVTFRDVFLRRKRARVPKFSDMLDAEIQQMKK